MIRDDLSEQVVHLTKGEPQQAASNFLSIVESRSLRGGTGHIRGAYRCVCFTEAPISKLGYVFAQPSIHGMPYAPLGVMVAKETLFAVGGRPVIYQPDSEFKLLDESIRFRHKEYDPEKGVDYSWEREWRIHTDEFHLEPNKVTLVVPNRAWSDLIFERHARDQRVMAYTLEDIGAFGIEKCPWHFLVLENLGISIDFEYIPK